MDLSSLLVTLGVDSSALTAGLQAAIGQLSAFASQAGAAGQQAGQQISDGFRQGNDSLKDNFKQVDDLTGGYQRLGAAISSAGATLTKYLTLPILAGGAAALKTSADFEKLQLGLQTLSKQDLALQGITGLEAEAKSAEIAKQRFAELAEIAKAPGIGLEQAVQGAVRLGSVGLSADLAKKSLVEFANAIAKSGGDATQLDSLTVQLGQLGASAKLTAADLKPILNAAPSVAVQLQKLYGTVSASDIQKQLASQGQSTKDFINTLVTELAKSERATGGLGNSFDNFGNAVQASLARVGDSLAKNLNLQELVDKAAAAIERLADAFTSLSPTTQKVLLGIAGAAAVIGPLLVAFGGIVAILPALEAGFATLGVSSLAALTPILPIAAAVGAAALLIYENWDKLVSYFEGPGAAALSGVADSLSVVVDAVKSASQAYDELAATVSQKLGLVDTANAKTKTASDNTLGGLISATGIFRKLFEDLTTGISALADTFSSAINLITDLVNGRFRQALSDGGSFVEALSRPLRNMLGLVEKVNTMSLGKFLSTQGKQTQLYAPGGEGDFGTTDFFDDGKAKQSGETLDQLKEKLKKLREEFGKTTTNTTEFFNLKKQIADLDAYIKKLEDTGKAARKVAEDIAKAFADAQNKVTGIDYQVKVGDLTELEGAVAKVKALQDAVKKVAELPGGIGSPQLVKLSQQAADAGRALDTLLASPALTGRTAAEIALKLLQPDTKEIDALYAKYQSKELEIQAKFEVDNDSVAKLQEQAENLKTFAQKALVNPANIGDQRVQSAVVNAPNLAFDAANKKNLQEYTTALQAAGTEQKLFGNTFDNTGAQLDATANRLRFLYGELAKKPQLNIAAGIQEEIDKLTPAFQELREKAAGQQLASDIKNAYIGAFEGLADALGQEIGKVIAGTESGQNALDNLFKAVLGTIGSFLQQIGSALIAYGVAMDAFKKAFANPYVAIAAGAALIILGGVISGLASAGPAKSSSGGGGSSAGASVGTSSGSAYNATKNTNLNLNVTFQPLKFQVEAASLRSVLQVDSYRLQTRR